MSADAKHPTDALLSLVYGELEEAEAARVEAHVRGCAECGQRLEEYRAVRKAAAALPREVASEKGLASLLHYGAQAAARTRKRRSTRLTASLLAGLVAAALVWVVWPQRPKEATWGSAPQGPAAVGPLAQNDVPTVARPEPQGLPEAPALRKAPSVASPRPSAAKAAARPTETDKPQRKQEATASEASDALASRDAAQGAVARLQAPPSASQRAALAGGRGTSGAGVSAAHNAAALSPSAPSPAAAPSSLALKTAPLDAGPEAQADAERRRTLLQQLKGASGPSALPVLSELCALDAKLLYRDEAQKTCASVVEGYPGTEEATAAQRVLDALNAR
jgi:Putative zinc-finger